MEQTGKSKAVMIFRLARNDIKARYASSLLGVIWAVVVPLVTILVFWYVFQLGFKNLPVGDAPYILWFSVAYIPWVFYCDMLISGSGCLVEYNYLVKKIKFDVRCIPVVKMLSSLFVHVFFLFFILMMLACYHYSYSVYNFQVLYYAIALCGLGLSSSYLLSAVTVFFKDTGSIVNLIIQIGFWITPIMWNEETMVDEGVRSLLKLNPVHYIIVGYRDSFLEQQWFWERPGDGLYFWGFTLVLALVGWGVFRRLRPFFADEV